MNIAIIESILVVFLYILLGYVANKLRILNDESNKMLTHFIMKITLPASIIASGFMQNNLNVSVVLTTILVALGVFILIPIISFYYAKIFRMEPIYKLMLSYSNVGFMGFPIIASVLGNESIFYVAIFVLVYNIHIFTVGVMTLEESGFSLRKFLEVFKSPAVISSLLAFGIVLLHISAPRIVFSFLSTVGNITSPLALIVIGSQLALVRVTSSLKNPKMYLMVLYRLVLSPLIVYLVLQFFLDKGFTLYVATILFGLPVGSFVTMLSKEYDRQPDLAAEGTYLTTIASLITIPILIFILL